MFAVRHPKTILHKNKCCDTIVYEYVYRLNVTKNVTINVCNILRHRVKGGNSGTLSYFSNFAYNIGFVQLRYGALANSIILL